MCGLVDLVEQWLSDEIQFIKSLWIEWEERISEGLLATMDHEYLQPLLFYYFSNLFQWSFTTKCAHTCIPLNDVECTTNTYEHCNPQWGITMKIRFSGGCKSRHNCPSPIIL